jgi:hypothetical protein
MHSKWKPLEQSLFQDLGERLKTYGFDADEKETQYHKSIEDRRLSLSLSLQHHRRYLGVLPYIGVRFESIERIIHGFNSTLSKKRQGQTMTVGGTMMTYSKTRGLYWSVTTMDEALCVSQELHKAFIETALPFYERFDTLEAVLEVCLHNQRGSPPLDEMQAKTALAIAYIWRQKELFDQIVQMKLEAFKTSLLNIYQI